MISIIVPIYKAKDYISDTISTVVNQTYTDWELLMVDDCSPDDSVNIIESQISSLPSNFINKIHLISKSQNEGAAAARNTGIDNAKGRYIAFLDADDIWSPYKLEYTLQFMQRHDATFVFTSYNFGDENAVPTGKIVRAPEKLTYHKALTRTVIFTSTVMIDTEKISKDLIHMPEVGSEDTATWWQILKTGVTAYGLDQPLATYRRPAVSLSSNKGTAIRRIWNLYRNYAHLNPVMSALCLFLWAFRATYRRVVDDTIRRHLESVKRFTVVQLSIIGIILQTALYAYTWFSQYYPIINSVRISQDGYVFGYGLKLYFKGHLLILFLYFVLLVVVTRANGGLKTGYLRPIKIIGCGITSLVVVNLFTYAQVSLMRNWIVTPAPMLQLTLKQIILLFAWAYISDAVFRRVFPPRETLVIHSTSDEGETSKIIGQLQTRPDRFNVMKVMSVKRGVEAIKEECLRWYGCVVIGEMEETPRNDILDFCYAHYIRVYYVPEISDLLIQSSGEMDLFNVPILELREYNIRWEERVIKRLLDIVLSAVGLVVTSPVMLYRFIKAKAANRPVLEKVECLTIRSNTFTRHRFEDDGFGKSLPMLIDVLRGYMSFVGPEALPADLQKQWIEDDPQFFYRLRVKAGFSSYAKMYGISYSKLMQTGKATIDNAKEVLKMDLLYVQHYSLLLDIKIMLSTSVKN